MEHLGRPMDIFNTQSVYRLFGKASIVTSGRNQSDKTIKQKNNKTENSYSKSLYVLHRIL